MSRRRGVVSEPVVQPVVEAVQEVAPWREPVMVVGSGPEVVAVREATTMARHCFSVCLYREPEFEKVFPKRDFWARYLKPVEGIREFLVKHDAALKLFVDEAMLPVAMEMGLGDVYVVTAPPALPWEQHVWRYYAALLPEHATIRAYHFRGLDNVTSEDMGRLERFVDGGYHLLRAPYVRGREQIWTPVRGSCSMAGEGLEALKWWLMKRRPRALTTTWPERFHIDEHWLGQWWNKSKKWLDVMSYVDRALPFEFWRETHAALLRGQRICVEGKRCHEGPMRRAMIDNGV